MTGRPNISSSHPATDQSDPWSDWALDAMPASSNSAPAAAVVDLSVPAATTANPGANPVWAANFEGTDEDDVLHSTSLVASTPTTSTTSTPRSKATFSNSSTRALADVDSSVEPAEDFTGEFEEIEAGKWDDTQFQYLDDDHAYADVDPVDERTSKGVSGPSPVKTKPRKRRGLRRVGIAMLTMTALIVGYVTWQFATLRRNEADGGTLDLPGVVISTLPGTPTTVLTGPQPTVPFQDPQTIDTFPVITNPGPTTPVVTIPGEGTCADDPICANAPVVVLPEVEKPREGGLLVDRVDVAPIGGTDATNILLIGSDSRADLPDAQKAGFGQVGGHRSDTIIVLRMSRDGKIAALLSFPRDTYVHLSGQNKNDRINSAYAKGVNSLVRTVQENFNVPITHVAEIDFSGFQQIVGTIGGVEICFDHPARDKVTNLNVKTEGCQTLNKTQATAYVRSRHYEQLINGQWVSDGRGDIGRVKRQQQFIKQVMQKVIASGGRNPIQAQALISDLKSAITLDKTWGLTELFGTAKTFSSFEPNALQNFTLPTSPANIDGKAVLRVSREQASLMVAKFGTRT